MARNERYLYVLLLAMLVAVRFFHMGEQIDDPHSWRQCDTAHYIWDFYENGIDLLHPAVCWLGGHETLILEFPLPEAIAAIGYKLFGPHHVVARLVFLLIFLGSAYYLFRLVKYLYHERLAWLAILIYLSLPLGIFYSRAMHVDFSAILCGLAAVYYLLRALRENRVALLLLGTGFASLGFLIKAPYLFYFGIPLTYFVVKKKKAKRALRYSPLLLVPVAFFYLWRLHAEGVNAAAPDWTFIPGYIKLSGAGMNEWYFGTWEQRSNAYHWKILFYERLGGEVLAYAGLLLLIPGLIFSRTVKGKSTAFVKWWLMGVLLYMILFFNLNYFHDYYQIPFLPVCAVLMAMGLEGLIYLTDFKSMSGLFLVPFFIWNIYWSETHPLYYTLDKPLIEAGEIIRANTEPEDLLILSRDGTDPRNPLLLYRARRRGWPIHIDKIAPSMIRKLRSEGADQAALLVQAPLNPVLADSLSEFPVDSFDIESDDRTLYLYDLK